MNFAEFVVAYHLSGSTSPSPESAGMRGFMELEELPSSDRLRACCRMCMRNALQVEARGADGGGVEQDDKSMLRRLAAEWL